MAENTAVATQTELGSLNFALQQAAENLASHANGSMSEAHGMDMYPGRADDGYGNDVTYYEDSNGDQVGTKYVRIILAGIAYYVPAKITTLAGKAPSTGITDTDLTAYGVSSGQGSSHWVTQFQLDSAHYIQEVLETYLLPHTEKGYWEAHTGFDSAITSATNDSAGHAVGSRLLPIPIDGNFWNIVASTRLGGPLQPVMMNPFNPTSVYYSLSAGSSADNPTTIYPVYVRGTKPLTYSYECYYGGIWNALPSGMSPCWKNKGTGAGTAVTYSSSTGILHQQDCSGPGGDDYDEIWLRLTVTNAAGNTHADINGNDLLFKIQVQDHAPCCWFARQCDISRKLSVAQWKIMGEIEKWLYGYNRRYCAWYVHHGKGLVERMLANGMPQAWFEEFITQITQLYLSQPERAEILYVKTVREMLLKHWPSTTRLYCLRLNKAEIPR